MYINVTTYDNNWNVVILDLRPTLQCPRFWFEPIWIKIKILWWNWRINLSYSVVLRPFKVVVQLPFSMVFPEAKWPVWDDLRLPHFKKRTQNKEGWWGISPSSSVKTVLNNWDLNQQNSWIPVESLQEPSNFGAAGSPANWSRKVLGRKRLKVGTILTLEKLEKNKLCQPTLGAHQWYGKRRHWRSRGTLAPHTGRGKKQCVYIYIYI